MAMRKGNNDMALATLQKAAELMPKDEDAQYYYGAAQLNVGLYKEAVESFDKSLKIWPRNDRALAGKGRAAFQSGQYEKSMEAFLLAYEADRAPRYLFERGKAAFFGKKYRDAQQSFARFETIFPKDAEAVFWYGLAAWRLAEDKNFALEKLEAAAKLSPQNELIINGLAMAKKGETLKFDRETEDVADAGKDPKKDPTKDPKKDPKQEVKPVVIIEDE
jgi:tetratricopeptide (TPR) repeat protein